MQSASWSSGTVTVTTATAHGYKLGETVALTIAGMLPDAYDGLHPCLITGPTTFTYPLAGDPGAFTQLGNASYNISLTAGYFASTMVFRQSSQTIEVNP